MWHVLLGGDTMSFHESHGGGPSIWLVIHPGHEPHVRSQALQPSVLPPLLRGLKQVWTVVVWETQLLGMPAPSTWDGSQGFQDPLLTMASLPTSLRPKLSYLKIGLRSTTGHQRGQPSSGGLVPLQPTSPCPTPRDPSSIHSNELVWRPWAGEGTGPILSAGSGLRAMGEGQAEPGQHGSLEPVRCR